MLNEFKAFIARGNVLDLAVGVIIGAAFGKIVTSLTESVIMPIVGWITGGTDFTKYFVLLGEIPAGYKGDPGDYATLKAAGVPMIGYGDFITQADTGHGLATGILELGVGHFGRIRWHRDGRGQQRGGADRPQQLRDTHDISP